MVWFPPLPTDSRIRAFTFTPSKRGGVLYNSLYQDLSFSWPAAGAFSLPDVYLLDIFIGKHVSSWLSLFCAKQASQPLLASLQSKLSIFLITLARFLCTGLFSSDTGHRNCTQYSRGDQFRTLLNSFHALHWKQRSLVHSNSTSNPSDSCGLSIPFSSLLSHLFPQMQSQQPLSHPRRHTSLESKVRFSGETIPSQHCPPCNSWGHWTGHSWQSPVSAAILQCSRGQSGQIWASFPQLGSLTEELQPDWFFS